VFDSGVGGLSVLNALREHLPQESFIYVADSGFAPYGNKSSEFINERALTIAQFLITRNVKLIVVACNTATVTAITHLRAKTFIPIIGMEPAIKPSVKLTRTGVVGVLATEQTINSNAVAALCKDHLETIRFLLQPCPGLVELVEAGDVSSDAVRNLLKSFIKPLLAQNADAFVLGCTHYVFLAPLIREIVGPTVAIVESSLAVARQVERRLSDLPSTSSATADITTMFYTTGRLETACATFSSLLQETIKVQPVNCRGS
jgi:glutamate racemase